MCDAGIIDFFNEAGIPFAKKKEIELKLISGGYRSVDMLKDREVDFSDLVKLNIGAGFALLILEELKKNVKYEQHKFSNEPMERCTMHPKVSFKHSILCLNWYSDACSKCNSEWRNKMEYFIHDLFLKLIIVKNDRDDVRDKLINAGYSKAALQLAKINHITDTGIKYNYAQQLLVIIEKYQK